MASIGAIPIETMTSKPAPASGGNALTTGTLDQFADVTQTAGKTLAITDNTTLAGGTHSGTNTGDQTSVSGNAATATALQNARTINGVSFNGTANITVTAAGSTLSDTAPVAKGGTGATTLTAHGVVLGNGTSAVAVTSAGTAGQVLTSNGASADPTYQGGIPSSFTFTSQTGVAASDLITSNTINLSGDSAALWPVAVRGSGTPQISINGGTWDADGVARTGDTLSVRLTASSAPLTELIATVYMPGRAVTFSVTTIDMWLPNILSPSLWNRADTLSLANNDSVTSWTDDSGHSRHMTESTNPPTFKTAILNGLPVVRFDGANDRLKGVAISNIITGPAFTMVMVMKASSIATNNASAYVNDSLYVDDGAAYFGLALRSGGPIATGYNYDGNYDTPTGVAIDTSGYHILAQWHGAGTLYQSADGNTANSAASGDTQVLTYLLKYGHNYDGTYKFTGDMAEVIFFPVALSDANRQKVEGYLAHKWGLAGVLPGGHPYKASPP